MSIIINLQNQSNPIHTRDGETLLSALRREGYSIPAACGGKGKCGKCRVSVNGVSRLACKVFPKSGDVVDIPEHFGGRILTETLTLPILPHDDGDRQLGYVAAIDLGTTTIALKFYDYRTGSECRTLTQWNRQASYGGDVVSRMEYIQADDAHLQELSFLVRTQCESMICQALSSLKAGPEELLRIILAGNTVMQHIFAGYPTSGIAVAPFRPYSMFEGDSKDTMLGAPIIYAPCASGYVGGDITAGLLATGLYQKDGSYLFLDIGTNGEMALGGKHGFLCCAVASGPAFEGAGISCGMAGVDGAISHIRYDNGFLYDMIGTGQPTGLCGSGLIDLVSELLRLECIDSGGRLLPPSEVPDSMRRYMTEDSNGNGFFRFNKEVYLTAHDIRNLQLAKAAVRGGIEILLSQSNLSIDQLDGIYLAGGFGTYINPVSAIHIGLLPKIDTDKLHVIGNTSLAGASTMALSTHPKLKICEIASHMKYIELSGRNDFADAFTSNMHF